MKRRISAVLVCLLRFLAGLLAVAVLFWPHWFLAVAVPAFLIWISVEYRVRQRIKRLRELGLCTNCEYDLRASKDRCPECGQRRTKELA